MKKTKIYILITFAILNWQCSNDNPIHVADLELITAPIIKPDSISSINIQLNKEIQYVYQSGYVMNNENDDEEFWGLDIANNSINIFNLSKKEYSHKIQIPKSGPKAINDILNFHVHSIDSIFVITANTGNIFLIDSEAEIKNSWNYKKLKLPTGESLAENFPFPMAEFGTHFFYQKDKINLTLPLWLRGTGKFYQVPPLINLNLANNMVESSFGVFPENYNGEETSIRDHINYTRLKNGEILVSFQESHYIQKYTSDGEFISEMPAKSNFVNEFKLFEKYPDRETSKNYWIENGFYIGLLYDPYKDLIYRIVCHGQPIKDINGRLNNPLMANWSIVILKPTGELIGELQFEGSKYRLNDGVFVSRNGILVSTENIYNINNIEESLDFDLIQFNVK